MNTKNTFTTVVKGRNAFTPHVVAYYKISNGAIELSTTPNNQLQGLTKSRFMENVFGVSVVQNNKLVSEKSNVFNSEKEAKDYINTFNPTQMQFYERVDCYGTMVLRTNKL